MSIEPYFLLAATPAGAPELSPFLAELIGTALVILLGNGVVANVLLSRTKGHGAGWIVITAGWALGVFVGVFCSKAASGAHLNPAVTLALAAAGRFAWAAAPGYILAQLLGAAAGGALVFLFYREHFKATDDTGLKLACFSTAPNIRRLPQAFFCEALGTFVLVLPIFLMTDPTIHLPASYAGGEEFKMGLGTLGALPVGLLVFAIGLSLGGTTGYAINPARDLGPRLAHALLPVPGKGGSDWGYAWVPVAGPVAGGLLAAVVDRILRS
jgi:glycerol uptake facilitator protein